MKKGPGIVVACVGVVAAMGMPVSAHAEQDEWAVYVAGGLIFPSFEPTDAVAFDLVSGFGGLGVAYGVHDNLWLDARVTLTSYRGVTREQVQVRTEVLEGNLSFTSTQTHPTLGLLINLYPGLNFSPYLFARGGFIISTFTNQTYLNDEGLSFAGVVFEDTAELQWTASVGLSFEYRFYQFLVVGVEPSFTKAFGEGRNDWFATTAVKFSVLPASW